MELPLKNLPVAALDREEQWDPDAMERALDRLDGEMAVLALPGCEGYDRVCRLADAIIQATKGQKTVICLESDMAKALGQCLSLRLPPNAQVLCLDRIALQQGDYLDIGKPLGPALPVVVKTLVLER